ncbi:MAG: YjbH domain-containing protein [Nevskia sp.]
MPLRATTAWCSLSLAVAGLIPATAGAGDFQNLNDLGGIGLLQTPTARFGDEGAFGIGLAHFSPYNQIQLFATPLPGFEAVFRYTAITDRLYGPVSFSGNQSYKDRSFGVKLRLIKEGEYFPAVAVGIQDFGGTGIFSSEYLVASRRYYDFDFSLGLGWGRLGEGGTVRNPLSLFGAHFDRSRQDSVSADQTPGGGGFSRLFTGRNVGFFGGVQWRTPIPDLSLKLEYDGNDYSNEEGIGKKFPQATPINIGLEYEVSDGVNIGATYERGEKLGFHVSLLTNFERNRGPRKVLDPKTPAIAVRKDAGAAVPENIADAGEVLDNSRRVLQQQGFRLSALNFTPAQRGVEVWIEQDRYLSPVQVVGRTARALTGTMPAWVDRFTIIGVDNGVEVWRLEVLRKDIEKIATSSISPEEMRHNAILSTVEPGDPQAQYSGLLPYPKFAWDMGPGVRQQIGGPDGFYFGQIYWRVSAGLQINQHLSFAGAVALNLVNNFDGIRQPSNSQLPHVRSDIVEYLQKGQQGITKLETNYIWSPAAQWYARLSGGLFEEMFGGVAGEVLYRPQLQRWAIGVNANVVQQRGYSERFTFRDYRVATGNLNLYYEFPWYNLRTKLSFGRYLAKDYGSTVELAREFRSGVTLGVFATFTNVSAARFGEGSFDKGFYVTVPLDVLFPKSSRRSVGFLFRPLTRDGGQKVRDGIDLYTATDGADLGRITTDWADVIR